MVPSGGPAAPLAGGLLGPEGLAVDGDRLLVVEEGADRVSAIDLASGAVTPVIDGLELGDRVVPAGVPHGNFNGVAANDGAIYVSEDGTNSVHEFKR